MWLTLNRTLQKQIIKSIKIKMHKENIMKVRSLRVRSPAWWFAADPRVGFPNYVQAQKAPRKAWTFLEKPYGAAIPAIWTGQSRQKRSSLHRSSHPQLGWLLPGSEGRARVFLVCLFSPLLFAPTLECPEAAVWSWPEWMQDKRKSYSPTGRRH